MLSLIFYGCLFLRVVIVSFVLQPEAPAASPLHSASNPEEEDDGDLNKALGIERFQQILSPTAVPDEQHHSYHEEDIECVPHNMLRTQSL